MIQGKGFIKGLSSVEAEAVQKQLFKQGYAWRSKSKSIKRIVSALSWDEDGIYSADVTQPLHTLSDFGLLPGGNPMLTMGDIEVGGKYVVREDLKVGEKYGGVPFVHPMIDHIGKVVIVEEISNDPSYDCFSIIGGGRYAYTPAMLSHRVEEDKPIDLKYPTGEDHPSDAVFVVDRPRFEFGGRVEIKGIEGLGEPSYFLTESEGRIYVTSEYGIMSHKDGKAIGNVSSYPSEVVIPWPEPQYETIKMGGITATVEPDGVTINVEDNDEKVSLNDFDALIASVSKIRKP